MKLRARKVFRSLPVKSVDTSVAYNIYLVRNKFASDCHHWTRLQKKASSRPICATCFIDKPLLVGMVFEQSNTH